MLGTGIAEPSSAQCATFGAMGPHNGGITVSGRSTMRGFPATRRNAAGRGHAGHTDYDWRKSSGGYEIEIHSLRKLRRKNRLAAVMAGEMGIQLPDAPMLGDETSLMGKLRKKRRREGK